MPELPEVEVIRRGLLPRLENRRILRFKHSDKKLRFDYDSEELHKHIVGKKIRTVDRRAKYLLFRFYTGDLLILHLGMTGKLGFFPEKVESKVHDHLFFLLDDGYELRFNDVRRFGSINYIDHQQKKEIEQTFFRTTGPEPFSRACSGSYLHRRAKGSRQPIKTFIMNSSIIAGVGNIYAAESLFAARIHPLTPAGKLSLRKYRKLIKCIREILLWAIDCGGSTINDFLSASGQQGYFQANFKVYGRSDQPCVLCQTPLKNSVIGGRASCFCPTCQRGA